MRIRKGVVSSLHAVANPGQIRMPSALETFSPLCLQTSQSYGEFSTSELCFLSIRQTVVLVSNFGWKTQQCLLLWPKWLGGNWKQGIVTPPCKLSYQERGQILHVSVFLEAFAGAQCSLYSPASQRILGLIGLSRFARLCPKWNRAAHILSSGSQITWKITLLAPCQRNMIRSSWT